MKRWLGLLVVVIMLTTAATCTAVAEQTTEENKDYTFGYIWFDIENEWEQYNFACFKDAADRVGVDIVEVTTDVGDPAKALAGAEDLITKKVDALGIFTITPELDVAIAKLANEADIPITFMNAAPAQGDFEYVSAVYTSYYECGYELAKYWSLNMPDAKIFFNLGALGMGISEPYLEAFEDAKEEHKGTWENVGQMETDWTVEKAVNNMQNFLQSGKEFNAVFVATEHQATGVISVLKDADLFGKVTIFTTGGGPTGLKMLENNEVTGTATAPVSLQGYLAFRDLWWAVNGYTAPKFSYVPAIFITKENIHEAISWEPSDAGLEYIGGLDFPN